VLSVLSLHYKPLWFMGLSHASLANSIVKKKHPVTPNISKGCTHTGIITNYFIVCRVYLLWTYTAAAHVWAHCMDSNILLQNQFPVVCTPDKICLFVRIVLTQNNRYDNRFSTKVYWSIVIALTSCFDFIRFEIYLMLLGLCYIIINFMRMTTAKLTCKLSIPSYTVYKACTSPYVQVF
jgi:hypothetical protein